MLLYTKEEIEQVLTELAKTFWHRPLVGMTVDAVREGLAALPVRDMELVLTGVAETYAKSSVDQRWANALLQSIRFRLGGLPVRDMELVPERKLLTGDTAKLMEIPLGLSLEKVESQEVAKYIFEPNVHKKMYDTLLRDPVDAGNMQIPANPADSSTTFLTSQGEFCGGKAGMKMKCISRERAGVRSLEMWATFWNAPLPVHGKSYVFNTPEVTAHMVYQGNLRFESEGTYILHKIDSPPTTMMGLPGFSETVQKTYIISDAYMKAVLGGDNLSMAGEDLQPTTTNKGYCGICKLSWPDHKNWCPSR